MKKVSILFVLVLSSAVALSAWLFWPFGQAKVDDFSDLRLERKALPDEKNFRIVLDEAAGLLPAGVKAPRWLLVAQTLRYKWDADAVTNILDQSEKARVRINKGLNRCEGYSNTEPIKTTMGYICSVCDNTDKNFALAWAMRVSFEHALQTGDAEGAYGLVCDMFRAASLTLDSPSGLADLSHASAWFACGSICCEKLIHHASCRDEWLMEMQKRMPTRSDIAKAGTAALRGEFGRLYPFTLRFSTWDKFYEPSCMELILRVQKRYWFFMDMTYRPEQTRRMLADTFRDAIAIVQSERVGTPLDVKAAFINKTFLAYFHPNAGGQIIRETVAHFNVLFVRRLKGLEAREECLRAVLACERYRRKVGAYPATLDALVPEFLAAVPHDPYRGSPMCFSLSREIVWSAGENRKDDGGTTDTADGRTGLFREERDNKALDLVYPVSSNQCAVALEALRRWHAKGHTNE